MKKYAIPPVAKAVYFIDGDQTASEYQSMVIEYAGALWLVGTWLQSNDTGALFPDRIIPLKNLPHVVEKNGLIQLSILMPRQLLSHDASPELLRKYGAEAHPALAHIPGPKSIH